MALFKCPECGNEVSEFADACPKCGFNIKAYVEDRKKKEAEEKERQENEKKAAEEAERKKQHDLEVKQRQEQLKNKFLGTKKKKVSFFTVIILLAIILIGSGTYYYKSTEDLREAKQAVDDTIKYLGEIDSCIYKYDEYGGKRYYRLSGLHLELCDSFAYRVRRNYKTLSSNEKKSFESYIQSKYSTSWKAVDERCIELGLDSSTWEVHAERDSDFYVELVKSLYEEHKKEQGDVKVTSKKMKSSGDNYVISGSVKNTTSETVYFVKVKVSLFDKDGNVINTDNTYAVGDEGLAPDETTTFECFINKVSGTKKYNAKVYDFSY